MSKVNPYPFNETCWVKCQTEKLCSLYMTFNYIFMTFDENMVKKHQEMWNWYNMHSEAKMSFLYEI